jgi:hypothetical protein
MGIFDLSRRPRESAGLFAGMENLARFSTPWLAGPFETLAMLALRVRYKFVKLDTHPEEAPLRRLEGSAVHAGMTAPVTGRGARSSIPRPAGPFETLAMLALRMRYKFVKLCTHPEEAPLRRLEGSGSLNMGKGGVTCC